MEQSLTGIGVTIEKMTETLAGEERQAVKLSGMLDVGMPIYQEQVYLKKGNYIGFTEKRVQTAEMQKSAATIDVAGGLHSWPEY